MNGPFWIRLGALFGGLSVAAGAFGAHGLRERLSPRMLEIFETAAHYQMVHALALIAIGLFALQRPSRCLKVSGIGFVLGILLFSGSLYALAISGVTKLGMITPLGGVAFLVGWVALMVASLKKPANGAS
jgi:uncharacterized membrane protein YgdD (TMEM256/DUF423 family)